MNVLKKYISRIPIAIGSGLIQRPPDRTGRLITLINARLTGRAGIICESAVLNQRKSAGNVFGPLTDELQPLK